MLATYHQGHPRYTGNGRQCMANAVQCLLKSRQIAPSKWNRSTMDTILDGGDKLFSKISKDNSYLCIDDIPKEIDGTSIRVSEPVHGTLTQKVSGPVFLTLEDGFSRLSCDNEPSGYILTMGSSIPYYSGAIIKEEEKYYFFDPHSRFDTGMLHPDGFACMTTHKTLVALCLFLRHLSASLDCKNAQFELASLNFWNLDYSSGSEFSGFDSEDENIAKRKLLIAQNRLLENTDISEMSDVTVDISENSDTESFDSNYVDQVLETLNDSSLFLQSIDVNEFDNMSDNENDDDDEGANDAGDQKNDDDDNDDDNSNVDENYDYFTDLKNVSDTDESELDDNIPLSRLKSRYNGNASTPNYNTNYDTEDEIPLAALRSAVQPSKTVDECIESQRVSSVNQCENSNLNTHQLPRTENEIICNIEQENIQEPVQASCGLSCSDEGNTGRLTFRKRKRDPSSWKRNVRMRRRNEGKSYIDKTGKVRPAKIMGQGCGLKCRYRCHDNFSFEDRQTMFHAYYHLDSIQSKRHFIQLNTIRKERKIKTKEVSRRNVTYEWFLPKPDGSKKKVCKKMFLDTIRVSDATVRTAYEKAELAGISKDSRGKHLNRPNKVSESRKQAVRDHINSYETVESHYCRKNSKKKYLPSELSVSIMHKAYEKKCFNAGIFPVKESYYRYIFNNEFNLAFHKPLKDQCDLCNSYENAPEHEKVKLKAEIERHLSNKELAKKEKEIDKQSATKEDSLSVAVFDLQEILLTPNAFDGCMYYKRRLNTYNFTIYDLATKDGHCYVWHESVASRGGCEIASCVFSFLKTMSEKGKKDFILYSDNCTSQNKNRFFVTMLWFAINTLQINSIRHKYLEKGHTFNEGDSIHSSIERATAGRKPIYSSPEWAASIRMARLKQPYIVKEMSLEDFYDFKGMSVHIKNFEVNSNNEKVYWNSIKKLKLEASLPHQFEYQKNYDGVSYQVNLFQRLRLREIPNPLTLHLQQLRSEYIQIPLAKYADLLSLCKKKYNSRHASFILSVPPSRASFQKVILFCEYIVTLCAVPDILTDNVIVFITKAKTLNLVLSQFDAS